MNTSKSLITKGGVFSTCLGLTFSFGINTCAFLPVAKCVGQVLRYDLRPQQVCSTLIQEGEKKKQQQNKSIIQIQQAISCSQANSLPLWTLIWTAQKIKMPDLPDQLIRKKHKLSTEELVKLVKRQDQSIFRRAAPTGLCSLGL